MTEHALYVLIGAAAGIVSGLGIGGGTILIPALVIFFGMEQQAAQNINLIYFIPTAAVAVVTHMKQGNIMKKQAMPLILWGVAASVAGALIAVHTDGNLLRKGFGFFLLAMGAYEIFGIKKEKREARMDIMDFVHFKERFATSDTDAKIDMYVTATGLSRTQYRELLAMFPVSELDRLEAALS